MKDVIYDVAWQEATGPLEDNPMQRLIFDLSPCWGDKVRIGIKSGHNDVVGVLMPRFKFEELIEFIERDH